MVIVNPATKEQFISAFEGGGPIQFRTEGLNAAPCILCLTVSEDNQSLHLRFTGGESGYICGCNLTLSLNNKILDSVWDFMEKMLKYNLDVEMDERTQLFLQTYLKEDHLTSSPWIYCHII